MSGISLLSAQEVQPLQNQTQGVDSVAVISPQQQGVAKRFPTFGLWRTSYVATGFQTNKRISVNTADVKFQFSIALHLWRIRNKADILFTYTQHSVWDIYRPSCPFRETAYNPGIWAAWQVSRKVELLFGIEHESNGMGGLESRSFNYATVACLYEPSPYWRLGARLWYGYYDIDNIERYFRYRGVGHLWATVHTPNNRFQFTVLVNPSNWFKNYNLHIETSWRLSKRKGVVPSLYAQYSCGYGDTMLDYNRYHTSLRIGIALKNDNISLY